MRRVILALALTAAAFATPPAHAKVNEKQALDDIRAVLAARASSIVAKNREGFAATIDPEAPAAFRDAQLRGFDGLSPLPITRLRLAISSDDRRRVDEFGDLTRGINTREYAGAPIALVPVTRSLRFTYDARASFDTLFWTFVQRDGEWYVGGDDDLADLGLESSVQLWDTGPVVIAKTEHVMLFSHPDKAARATALTALAERALTTLAPRLPLPWSQRLVGFVPSSPAELADILQASVDVTEYVAFIAYGYSSDTLKPTVPRLFVQDANLSRYSDEAQVETLVHEFVHAAGSAYASAFLPVWMHEGLADWVAEGPDLPAPRSSNAGANAPRDAEFGAGSQAQIVRAYRDARSLVSTLAKLKGRNAPFDLFRAVGATQVRPGSGVHVLDASLQTLGFANLSALEAAWRNQ